MLDIEYHTRFKRDYKLALKRGCEERLLSEVVEMLAAEKALPERYRDHSLALSKKYAGMRECHIQPDWLLVYKTDKERLTLILCRTGTHSDLF